MRQKFQPTNLLTFMIVALSGPGHLSAQTNAVPCEIVLNSSYDQYRGLYVWPVPPKIDIPASDKFQNNLTKFAPKTLSELWRYLNDLKPDAKFDYTPYPAIRFKSIKDVEDLEDSPSYYAPINELLRRTTDLVTQDKIEKASKIYIKNKIDFGDKIITGYKVQKRFEGRIIPVATISPVIRNFNVSDLEVQVALLVSFFDVLTNLRVGDNWFLTDKISMEFKAGCLEGNGVDCSVLEIGRSLYRNASVLAKKPPAEVTEAICHMHKQQSNKK